MYKQTRISESNEASVRAESGAFGAIMTDLGFAIFIGFSYLYNLVTLNAGMHRIAPGLDKWSFMGDFFDWLNQVAKIRMDMFSTMIALFLFLFEWLRAWEWKTKTEFDEMSEYTKAKLPRSKREEIYRRLAIVAKVRHIGTAAFIVDIALNAAFSHFDLAAESNLFGWIILVIVLPTITAFSQEGATMLRRQLAVLTSYTYGALFNINDFGAIQNEEDKLDLHLDDLGISDRITPAALVRAGWFYDPNDNQGAKQRAKTPVPMGAVTADDIKLLVTIPHLYFVGRSARDVNADA